MTVKNFFTKENIDPINSIFQIIALCIGGYWVLFNFILAEHRLDVAPINISMDMSLKKTGAKNDKASPLIAIELKASAMNPGIRPIHLLPSMWVATGKKIVPHKYTEDEFADLITQSGVSQSFFSEYMEEDEVVPISMSNDELYGRLPLAFGKLTDDDTLKPSEKVNRTLVFYVPKGEYDVVSVCAEIISSKNEGEEFIEKWSLNRPEDKTSSIDFIRVILHKEKDGALTPITDNQGVFINKFIDKYEIETYESCYDLSLNKPEAQVSQE
jgi:hypothetical protein